MSSEITTLADEFERGLRERAQQCGWSTVPNSELLHESPSGVGALLETLPREEEATLRLPEARRAYDFHPASLSLLLCGVSEAEESYRAALWWAGLVRSEIAPPRRSDLHLFLIGPPGSSKDAKWRGRQSRIESDERFCRKFVWLPSETPTEKEVAELLDRTFLAQPWKAPPAEPRPLDPLERLVEEADLSGLLTAVEAREWIRALSVGDRTRQMAEELVGILERPR